jgi:hypothetical protein
MGVDSGEINSAYHSGSENEKSLYIINCFYFPIKIYLFY